MLRHPSFFAGWASVCFLAGLWEIVGHYGHNGYFQKIRPYNAEKGTVESVIFEKTTVQLKIHMVMRAMTYQILRKRKAESQSGVVSR